MVTVKTPPQSAVMSPHPAWRRSGPGPWRSRSRCARTPGCACTTSLKARGRGPPGYTLGQRLGPCHPSAAPPRGRAGPAGGPKHHRRRRDAVVPCHQAAGLRGQGARARAPQCGPQGAAHRQGPPRRRRPRLSGHRLHRDHRPGAQLARRLSCVFRTWPTVWPRWSRPSAPRGWSVARSCRGLEGATGRAPKTCGSTSCARCPSMATIRRCPTATPPTWPDRTANSELLPDARGRRRSRPPLDLHPDAQSRATDRRHHGRPPRRRAPEGVTGGGFDRRGGGRWAYTQTLPEGHSV